VLELFIYLALVLEIYDFKDVKYVSLRVKRQV